MKIKSIKPLVLPQKIFKLLTGKSLKKTASVTMLSVLMSVSSQCAFAQIERNEASDATRTVQAAVLQRYDFSNREDFEFATRGFIADLNEPQVMTEGKLIRDYRGWEIFEDSAPDTVNPSLWRLGQVQSRTGLFQVTERIYQVRGMDLANMSVIVGDTGYIIVDPFLVSEVAEAALQLVRDNLGDKPVTGVILTHSHTDHYGGVLGVVSAEDAASGKVAVIAPEGFVEALTLENGISGPAMTRRTGLAFGFNLGFGPQEAISYGLGPAYNTGMGPGTTGMVVPNILITENGQMVTVDGIDLEFLNIPGAEAPSELVFYVIQEKALCVAEIANASLHNVLTLRGARVRDTLLWADYLTEIEQRYGNDSEVVFGSHFWPRFGNEKVGEFLGAHRDMYKYLHDQTVRMMNNGMTMREIAEVIELPESLQEYWFNREYYGTLSHNSKAIYQHYLGWYDANPANLNRHPPTEVGTRYVEALGGVENTFDLAQQAYDEGDYRWASELLSHLLFSASGSDEVRLLQAASFEQMGYQAESAMWRNAYLSAAVELRDGNPANFPSGMSLTGYPISSLLDMFAVRLDPALSKGARFTIGVIDSGTGTRHIMSLANDVLVDMVSDAEVETEITVSSVAFGRFLTGEAITSLESEGVLSINGNRNNLIKLQSYIQTPRMNFPVVMP